MKQKVFRVFALLLAAAVLLGCLPAQALAAEEEAGWFYLVADWNGELLIAPERVPYTSKQTLFEALNASGHTFGPSETSVTKIDGKAGNFSRGDETGGFDLTRNALKSGVRYLRFVDNSSGSRTAKPSEAMQALIAAMAEYTRKSADVQKAAKAEYDDACQRYCAADDADALTLSEALTGAISRYEQSLNGTKYRVSFTDENGVWTPGETLTAENAYGRTYTDENRDGALELPAGSYTFTMEANASGLNGTVHISGDQQVTVALAKTDWLLTEGMRLSSRSKKNFDSGEFFVRQTERHRELETSIDDSFAGTLYAYWPYDTSGPQIALTAIYTPAGEARAREVEQARLSKASGIDGALTAGSEGNTIIYRASLSGQAYTQYQDYTLRIVRTPTLAGLELTEVSGAPAAVDYDESMKTFTAQALGSELTLRPLPNVPGSCTILVDGAPLPASGELTVTAEGAETSVQITLRGDGTQSVYTLIVRRTDGCTVEIPVSSADIALTVCDQNGTEVPGTTNSKGTVYRYQLIPNREYTFTATDRNAPYCHATGTFTAVLGSLPTVSVENTNWLTELALGTEGSKDKKGSIRLEQQENDHSYTAVVPDTISSVYLWVDGKIDDAKVAISARYHMLTSTAQDDEEKSVVIASDQLGQPVYLQNLLMTQNGHGNLLTVRYSRQADTVTYYQDYEIAIQRKLSLKSLAVVCGGQEAVLTHSGGASGYTPSCWEYIVTVPAASTELFVSAEVYDTEGCYRDNGLAGYHIQMDGQALTSGERAAVTLRGDTTPETVTLTVTNDFAEGISNDYTILVRKAKPVLFTPNLTPEDALLFVKEDLSGRRVWSDENGAFELSEGFSYSYLLTCAGYVGRSGKLQTAHDANGDLVLCIDADSVPVSGGAASAAMTLIPAEKNGSLQQLPAEWADFRGTTYDQSGKAGGSAGSNNTVLAVPTPVRAEDSTLYWASKIGDGFDSGATGCPLLVDGVLITYAGSTIYRIDPVSGEILTKAPMERSSSFAITPPAYARGMVFVGLSDGTVQAFDAKTLKSLWVYHDPLKGQPNCPITICGDYLYTGFWRGEEFTANFVCLSITDEKPDEEKEEKTACWYWTQQGGYYWAGAYANEDYVLVGTDDGLDGYRSKTGSLLMLDAKTGKLLDQWTGLLGDVRSTVCYDEKTDAFYFTTKGGWFCGVQTEQTADGAWHLKGSSKWTLKLETGRDSTEPAMSTSTPTVYNGRAYIGVSGTLQFGAYSGHSITVVDLASRSIAYRAETMGYPQTSGILTTVYEENTKCVYVYFIDNYTPGKLRVLRDEPGQTSATYVTKEYGVDMPYILFTPSGEEAQYAICTPIVDKYGVMYFKNDTARMMAFGPSVKELKITKQPDKTTYREGETFDPTGMQVMLVYANGMERDVTKYVTWTKEPLTKSDDAFAISFLYVKYHDTDSGSEHQSNVKTTTPYATLALTIRDDTQPGQIGGFSWTYTGSSGKLAVTTGEFGGRTLVAACYDKAGRLTQAQTMTQPGELTLPSESASIRLFLLDQTNKPVDAAVTLKG